MKPETSHELNEMELQQLGLDPEEVSLHQTRIEQSLHDKVNSFLKILDTCRLDNGGILPREFLPSDLILEPEGYVSFIPAAGAATRYYKSFRPLIASLENEDEEQVAIELAHLKQKGLAQWSLPLQAKEAMLESAKVCLEQSSAIIKALEAPKAVQPFKDGTSYLQAKHSENKELKGLSAEVYIVPQGKVKAFSSDFEKHSKDAQPLFLEQGPNLSTIRFHQDASPYRDEYDRLSPVPAGHGALAKLFPKILKQFPHCHSLFIRNIDNVIGTHQEAIAATESFLSQHQYVLGVVKDIRHFLKEGALASANEKAKDLLANIPLPGGDDAFVAKQNDGVKYLWQLQIELFHCNPASAQRYFGLDDPIQLLTRLYKRPVNTLGQVPNSGKDIGGTPVLIETSFGLTTLCLEVPHASPEDKDKYLANPQKATHFNPVFVAAELVEDVKTYTEKQSPFWILAHKHWDGHDVIYHETVLYELLGNGLLSNAMFPEIPRLLFNPHKSVADTAD